MHSGVDIGALVRDFTKWDDQPASLQHFAELAVRAYKIATTPPMGPVFLALDAELQENPIPDGESLHIPKLAPVVPPQGDAGAIAAAAKMLVEAQNPVIGGGSREGGENATLEGTVCQIRARRRTPSSSAIAWRARRRAWRTSSTWPKRCNAA